MNPVEAPPSSMDPGLSHLTETPPVAIHLNGWQPAQSRGVFVHGSRVLVHSSLILALGRVVESTRTSSSS